MYKYLTIIVWLVSIIDYPSSHRWWKI